MKKKKIKKSAKKEQPTAKRFAIDVSWSFISLIFTLIIGVILKVILGNYFAAKGLGLYSMVLVLQALLVLISSLGIPETLIKFVSEYKDDKKRLSEVISSGLINAFLMGWLITFLFLLFANNIASLFGMPDLAALLRIVAFIFPFYLVNDVFIGIFNGFREMKKYTFITIFRRGGLLVFTLLFVILGWGVEGAVFAMVFVAILSTLLNLILFRKKSISIQLTNHFTRSKELIKFSSHLLLANSIGYINTHVDMLLIGYFLTDERVGIYAVAVMFARLLLLIPNAIQRISYPMTSEYYSKKNLKKIERLINVCMRYTFVMTSVLSLLLIFFGDFIIRLIYPSHSEFLNAYRPLVILVVGFCFYSVVVSIGATFTAIGKPDITLKTSAIAAIVNICLNIYLIPIYGLVGGAIATSISVNLAMIFLIIMLIKILKIRINFNWLIFGFVAFTVFIIIYFVGSDFFNPYLLIILLFPLFVLLIYLGKVIVPSDREFLHTIIFKK